MSGENDETGSLTAQCASLIAPYEVCWRSSSRCG